MPLLGDRRSADRPTPPASRDRVVLVDALDRTIGTYPKLAAHREGRLHRAISVFVRDADQRLLLQRRATTKYHSGGLWSNTCCTHPMPDESTEAAAHRRLGEEMGFDCDLECSGHIIYHAVLAGGLIEHEYDYVFVGQFAGQPEPNPTEVADWRWIRVTDLLPQRDSAPEAYTAWLWPVLEHLLEAGWPGPDLARPESGPPAGISQAD